MKYFNIFILAVLLFFSSCNFFDDKKNENNIVVILQNNALGCVFGDSAITGFQYEIVKEFADSFNYQLNIILSDNLEHSIRRLNKGDADILAQCLPTTVALKKQLNFSVPLYKTKLVLIQKKRTKKDKNLLAKNIFDLEDKTIFITGNSPYIKQLEYIIEDSGIKFNIAKKNNSSIEKLAEQAGNGKIPYLAADEMSAKHLSINNKEIDYSMKLGLNQFMAWGINKKNRQLNTQLNSFLENFIKTEKYRQIFRKYF
jgi:membrane-bound lytic murein transglycosylase F